MKYEEVISTWQIFMEAIDSLPTKNIKKDKNNENNEIIEKSKQLAKYSCCNNNENISKNTLMKMEKEGKIFSSHIFSRLARHFYLAGILEEKNTTDLCKLLQTIHNYLGNNFYFCADKETVKNLLLLGNEYTLKDDYIINKYDERMGRSALYLKKLNFDVSVKMGTISYSEETSQKIFDDLEHRISSIGGVKMLNSIMAKYLLNCYNADIDMYIIGRKSSDEQNNPINLLFQLSAKHIGQTMESSKYASNEKEINVTIKLAEAFLNICDIQASSAIEYCLMNTDQFPIYLKNEMIFDKICVPQQYSPKFILTILDYLIKPWFSYAKKTYSYQDYYKVAEYVLKIGKEVKLLDFSNMEKETKVPLNKLKMIVEDVSISCCKVNKEFTSLDGKINLFTRPIISLPPYRYICLDSHFCGIGFFYAGYDMIKPNYEILDRGQGDELENMLRNEMIKKGYSIKYGNYPEQRGMKNGQCDLVLENKKITFIEIKKKSIRDEMDTLDDVTVLERMSYGMMRAQEQCFIHEEYLQINRDMKLNDGQYVINSNSNNLPAYKISVCFTEYSFLTSKMFSMNLIEVLLLGEFKTKDTNLQCKLDKLNQIGASLRKYVSDYYKGNKVKARDISFNSLFCSMQQILTVVWLCKNEKEFFDMLNAWIHVADKTLNPYYLFLLTKYRFANPNECTVSQSMMELVDKRNSSTMVIR